jgi:hypothetical protein
MTGKLLVIGKGCGTALLAACLGSALGFLGLIFGSGEIRAAPPAQSEGLRLVLPVINTNDQTSVYTVTNLSETNSVSAVHQFYAGGYPGGQVIGQFSDTLNPSESKAYALNIISNLPTDFTGDVVVTASQPVAGSVIIRDWINPTPTPGIIITAPEITPIFPLPSPTIPLPGRRAEVNWTLVTYIVVGLFALSGFFKGWWKEAITTFFVGILILLLAVPLFAQWFIDLINWLILTTWELLAQLGLTQSGNFIQLDAGSSGTWLAILMLLVGLAIFISRASLPNVIHPSGTFATYVVTPLGSLLGGLLGGLNGFLIINLIRHYLEGTNLPNSGLSDEIVSTGVNSIGTASSGVGIQLTDLPDLTLFNTLLPVLIVFFGILILFLRWKSDKWPWGYVKYTSSGGNLSRNG